MYKYYLIYKTNKLRVKSFEEYDYMIDFLLRLKVENKHNDKFKYKVVYGYEPSSIYDHYDYVGLYDFCSKLFDWKNN